MRARRSRKPAPGIASYSNVRSSSAPEESGSALLLSQARAEAVNSRPMATICITVTTSTSSDNINSLRGSKICTFGMSPIAKTGTSTHFATTFLLRETSRTRARGRTNPRVSAISVKTGGITPVRVSSHYFAATTARMAMGITSEAT